MTYSLSQNQSSIPNFSHSALPHVSLQVRKALLDLSKDVIGMRVLQGLLVASPSPHRVSLQDALAVRDVMEIITAMERQFFFFFLRHWHVHINRNRGCPSSPDREKRFERYATRKIYFACTAMAAAENVTSRKMTGEAVEDMLPSIVYSMYGRRVCTEYRW